AVTDVYGHVTGRLGRQIERYDHRRAHHGWRIRELIVRIRTTELSRIGPNPVDSVRMLWMQASRQGKYCQQTGHAQGYPHRNQTNAFVHTICNHIASTLED